MNNVNANGLMSGLSIPAASIISDCRIRFQTTLCTMISNLEDFNVKAYSSADDSLVKIIPYSKQNFAVVEAYKSLSPSGAIMPGVFTSVHSTPTLGKEEEVRIVLAYLWYTIVSSAKIVHSKHIRWDDLGLIHADEFRSNASSMLAASRLFSLWMSKGVK